MNGTVIILVTFYCITGLLRVTFQSVRLLRRYRIDKRNDFDQHTRYATPWCFGTTMCETPQSL